MTSVQVFSIGLSVRTRGPAQPCSPEVLCCVFSYKVYRFTVYTAFIIHFELIRTAGVWFGLKPLFLPPAAHVFHLPLWEGPAHP